MGDEAEQVLDEIYPKGLAPFGLSRPPIRVGDLPLKIRYMPDRLSSDELIEAMGVGRDGLLKLKLEKWLGMSMWAMEMPLRLFIWHSTKKRYGFITHFSLTQFIAQGVNQGRFNEGKAYYEIPIDELEITWTAR